MIRIFHSQTMKRLSGAARYRILIGFVVFILFYYAIRSFNDYSNKLIHEVSIWDTECKSTPFIKAENNCLFRISLNFPNRRVRQFWSPFTTRLCVPTRRASSLSSSCQLTRKFQTLSTLSSSLTVKPPLTIFRTVSCAPDTIDKIRTLIARCRLLEVWLPTRRSRVRGEHHSLLCNWSHPRHGN